MSIMDKIRDAGVVGEGGAGFPTAVKVNCKADIVIANGAECEPLLRVDQQVMQYFPELVVRGLRLEMEQTGASRGVIALKSHYHDAIAALREVIGDASDITIHEMFSYYPAGDEQQIVYDVTGKVVPTGGIPIDVGAVVSNVSTLMEVAKAVDEGTPVIDKFVTVGADVENPCTLRAPIGMQASELVERAGGAKGNCVYIVGGPCMGKIRETLDFPIEKTTGGILAIPKDHPLLRKKTPELNLQMIQSVCCQCMMCTQMCPRNSLGLNVTPNKVMRSIGEGENLLGDWNGIFSCCDCGVCTYYACNFGLKPHVMMTTLKTAFLKDGKKPKKEVYGSVDPAFKSKKLPTSRLIGRLGISSYDVAAPMDTQVLYTDKVKIPLKMNVGAPSVPVVSVGQNVTKGQLIADIKEGALGAKIHASIDGTVVSITDQYIEIKGN